MFFGCYYHTYNYIGRSLGVDRAVHRLQSLEYHRYMVVSYISPVVVEENPPAPMTLTLQLPYSFVVCLLGVHAGDDQWLSGIGRNVAE